jgi:hypothetical protein
MQLRRVAAQDVSTAFLDAYLNKNARARGWLAADASRWLGSGAELRSK